MLNTHPPASAETEWSYGSTPPYAFFGGNKSDSPCAALQKIWNLETTARGNETSCLLTKGGRGGD